MALSKERPTAVVCLECGKEFDRRLTNSHLRTHGLTHRQYKDKHRLPKLRGLTTQKAHDDISEQVRARRSGAPWDPGVRDPALKRARQRRAEMGEEFSQHLSTLGSTEERRALNRIIGRKGGLRSKIVKKETQSALWINGVATVRRASQLTGIPEQTLYDAMGRGDLETVDLGEGRRGILEESLEEFAQKKWKPKRRR